MQVIRLALVDASLDPARIGCLEMHGTGTPPGRPHRGRRRGGRLWGRSLFRSCCQVRLQEKPKRFIRLMDVLSTYNEVQVSMQAFVREVIG